MCLIETHESEWLQLDQSVGVKPPLRLLFLPLLLSVHPVDLSWIRIKRSEKKTRPELKQTPGTKFIQVNGTDWLDIFVDVKLPPRLLFFYELRVRLYFNVFESSSPNPTL